MDLISPFSSAEARTAQEEWGCNCGPAALAFALRWPLDKVRDVIPGFASRRYTNPTMMAQALAGLGRGFTAIDKQLFRPAPALVRIQWTGPWTQPGANPKWAYRQTHWVCCWRTEWGNAVFDINYGIARFSDWQDKCVPAITETIPRADGGWHQTHVYRLID